VRGMPFTGMTKSCSLKLNWPTFMLASTGCNGKSGGDIAGAVASMTKGDPGVLSEELQTTPLVNWDSPESFRGFDVE